MSLITLMHGIWFSTCIANHDCVKGLQNPFLLCSHSVSIIYLDLNLENCILKQFWDTSVSKLMKNAHFSNKFGVTLPRMGVNALKRMNRFVSIYR